MNFPYLVNQEHSSVPDQYNLHSAAY